MSWPDAGEMTVSEADASVETPWESLHPSSLLVNLGPRIWQAVKGFWWLIFIAVFGGGGWSDLIGVGIGLTGVAGLGVGSAVIHFATLRYRVHLGRLEIRQGLLNRQVRIIDPERIQNAELVRNVAHKAFGLVEVRLETAGGSRTEGMLSALSEEEASRLMGEIDRLLGRATDTGEPVQEELVLRVGVSELVAYGLTSRTVGTVAILGGLAVQALEMVDPEEAVEQASSFGMAVLVAIIALAFALSFGLSVSMALARHWRYRLSRTEDQLRAEFGLFTRRRASIPLEKVQLTRADEPLLRRWLGYGTLSVETAGLGSVGDNNQASEASIPMVPREDLGRVSRVAIPVAGIDAWVDPLEPPHPRSFLRALYGATGRSLVLGASVAVVLAPWGALALLLVPASWFATWLDHRAQGWQVTPSVVLSRRGFWRRRTALLARNKVQSVHLVQGPLMRRHGLGRLLVRVAGSQVALPDIGYEEAEALLERLRPPVRDLPGPS